LETEKNILVDLFISVLPKFKKYHNSGNLKFNHLGIFQSLKLRNLMGKILRISLMLNLALNTLDCYGLSDFNARGDAHFGTIISNWKIIYLIQQI